MTLTGFLEGAVIALALLFLAGSIFLLGYSVRWVSHRRATAERLARARSAMNAVVMKRDPRGEFQAILRDTPTDTQEALLLDLSRSITGAIRDDVMRMAIGFGAVRRLQSQLRSGRWWRRLHAARALQELPIGGKPFLPLLRDRNAAVRAQGVQWAARYPLPDVAEALVPLLDDESRLSRFAVHDALLRIGAVSGPALLPILEQRSGRAVIPALRVALELAHPAFVAPATRLSTDADEDVRSLAVDLLGATGGKNATEALLDRLDDDAPRVRAAAARALGRVGHWPAAPRVAALLRDSAWDVRQAAAIALRRMGSPGTLLLRQYRNDSDAFAADMARQVLDLPEDAGIGR